MLILKSCVSPLTCFKIFYKWPKTLQIMSNGEFEDTINDIDFESSDEKGRQEIYVEYLKSHEIRHQPQRVEFLFLFSSLLESKIRFQIKKEFNTKIIKYFDELPTLILRCKPHRRIKLTYSPFTNKNLKRHLQKNPTDLGKFIVESYTYNSADSIFSALSDFALVEHYGEFNQKKKTFDLQNEQIKDFFDQRNPTVHDLVDSKIDDITHIQNNLEDIFLDIISMVSRALIIRGITIDNLQTSEKDHIIISQSQWLKTILEDLEKVENEPFQKMPKRSWFYSEYFNVNDSRAKVARDQLKSGIEIIQKKLEASKNV